MIVPSPARKTAREAEDGQEAVVARTEVLQVGDRATVTGRSAGQARTLEGHSVGPYLHVPAGYVTAIQACTRTREIPPAVLASWECRTPSV